MAPPAVPVFANDRKPVYHFLRMVRFARLIVALLCIVCVLALCVAPYVDIPLTVLKSIQIVLLFAFFLAAAEISLSNLIKVVFVLPTGVQPDRATHMRAFLPPLEKNCVMQC